VKRPPCMAASQVAVCISRKFEVAYGAHAAGAQMRIRLIAAITLTLAATVSVTQAQTAPYLKEFPSVDRVLKVETTSDPQMTALLQMTALGELTSLVRIMWRL
jgi:hypothetical protein